MDVVWKHIDDYEGCGPALVSYRNRYGAYVDPLSSFRDVTGVWRMLGSKGGMTRLPFSPTVFAELPRVKVLDR